MLIALLLPGMVYLGVAWIICENTELLMFSAYRQVSFAILFNWIFFVVNKTSISRYTETIQVLYALTGDGITVRLTGNYSRNDEVAALILTLASNAEAMGRHVILDFQDVTQLGSPFVTELVAILNSHGNIYCSNLSATNQNLLEIAGAKEIRIVK
jgi:hypothetical protein